MDGMATHLARKMKWHTGTNELGVQVNAIYGVWDDEVWVVQGRQYRVWSGLMT
ncbi:hypothetical protein MA16_Dca026796 [Dendrobium catenatum]|uniref:Uncharacterized protein n=1 Tax=Dendrobium catenatum TaxID=906689 RepID=A0A2I0WXX8_9ASPA|nr:hypothetical protein MA16_Dca026796 [Dendrobium catenatum]